MPRGATVFDGMASETLKQLLYVHYSAANLSEADKQEYLGIVEEEEDYNVLLELCASEGVAAPTAAAPPPTAGPPPAAPRPTNGHVQQQEHVYNNPPLPSPSAPATYEVEQQSSRPPRKKRLPPLLREVKALVSLGRSRTPATPQQMLPRRGPPPALPTRERFSTEAYSDLQRNYNVARGCSSHQEGKEESEAELSIEQVVEFLRTQGQIISDIARDDIAQQYMAAYDVDGNGTLSLDEFACLIEDLNAYSRGQEITSPAQHTRLRGHRQKIRERWDAVKAHSLDHLDDGVQFPRSMAEWRELDITKQVQLQREPSHAWALTCVCFGGWIVWQNTILVGLLGIILIVIAIIAMYTNVEDAITEYNEYNCVEAPVQTTCMDQMSKTYSTDVEPAVDLAFVVDTSDEHAMLEKKEEQKVRDTLTGKKAARPLFR